jgi:hypothetical protein
MTEFAQRIDFLRSTAVDFDARDRKYYPERRVAAAFLAARRRPRGPLVRTAAIADA